MNKVVVIIVFICQLFAYSLFAQDSASNEEAIEKDLYLTDNQLIKKHIDKLKASDTRFFLRQYKSIDDPEIKIYLLKLVVKKGFADKYVVKIFDIALEDGVSNPVAGRADLASHLWKVRAAAAYLLSENPDGLDNDTKFNFVNRLIRTMKRDPEERCRAMAALAMGKLYEKLSEEVETDKDRFARSDILRKNTIIAIINERLRTVTKNEQYLCWGLVKSLGYLKSKKSFFILMITKKRGFNKEVNLEINRSLNIITQG